MSEEDSPTGERSKSQHKSGDSLIYDEVIAEEVERQRNRRIWLEQEKDLVLKALTEEVVKNGLEATRRKYPEYLKEYEWKWGKQLQVLDDMRIAPEKQRQQELQELSFMMEDSTMQSPLQARKTRKRGPPPELITETQQVPPPRKPTAQPSPTPGPSKQGINQPTDKDNSTYYTPDQHKKKEKPTKDKGKDKEDKNPAQPPQKKNKKNDSPGPPKSLPQQSGNPDGDDPDSTAGAGGGEVRRTKCFLSPHHYEKRQGSPDATTYAV